MKTEQKLITCIVRESMATKGAAALRETYKLQTINQYFSRGIGKSSPLIKRGMGEKTEKVVLSVVVNAKIADEVFEFLFHAAEINQPRGGMIYMTTVRSVAFEPITLPKKEEAESAQPD